MTIRRSRLKKYNSLFFALGVLGCPIPKSHFLFGDLPVPHATSSRALHATTHVIVAGDPYQVHRRGSHCDWTAPGLRYKPRRWQYHGQGSVCSKQSISLMFQANMAFARTFWELPCQFKRGAAISVMVSGSLTSSLGRKYWGWTFTVSQGRSLTLERSKLETGKAPAPWSCHGKDLAWVLSLSFWATLLGLQQSTLMPAITSRPLSETSAHRGHSIQQGQDSPASPAPAM